MLSRALSLFITLSIFLGMPAAAQETVGVGLYIGSFDPPTEGHRKVLEDAIKLGNLDAVYISVNRGGPNSDKDYNASISERIEMLRRMLGPLQTKVRIIPEPLEGRVALAEHLKATYHKPVRGIFGADTLKKNYDIFKGVKDFEYLATERPGYDLPDLSATEAKVYKLPAAGEYSSTEVRNQIQSGKERISALAPEVESYIRENNFYVPAEIDMKSDKDRVAQAVLSRHTNANIRAVTEVTFKEFQSHEARKDKLIRVALDSAGEAIADVASETALLEKAIQSKLQTKSLSNVRHVGVFLGSFDPISSAQAEVILQAKAELGLTEVVLLPLITSRKKIKGSIDDRVSILRDVATTLNTDASVVSVESLESSVNTIEEISKLNQGAKITAIFGENIFRDNYTRLAGIKNLDFAVYSLESAPPVLAMQRTTVLRRDVRYLRAFPESAVNRIAKSKSYGQCTAIFAKSPVAAAGF